ncbi:hypothetical protein RhiJN_26758 [Ceratobasidium sp. AG-Ba]|nr:hypothetical protein RhiJN_12706 [Ceratobasidium sp. AG-Ba]QRV98739.1 hypothetical protein RhiJN_26758 [Ceratobasidium sp. AG-Ba]
MADLGEVQVPCPYSVGSSFYLMVTPTAGPPFKVQASVIKTYAPFTISPVMLVSIDCMQPNPIYSPPLLPNEPVLKVYDRRFTDDLRKEYHLEPSTYDSEARYDQQIASERVPVDREAISKELDAFDSFDTSPRELLEHLIATRISPHFASECAAYQRLQSLQGRDIPMFYGSVEFLNDSLVPGLRTSVPGISLERITGTNLDTINTTSFNIDDILDNARRIVDTCGDLCLLNYDVRLGNFIVQEDSSVVMIDFAQSRLRAR